MGAATVTCNRKCTLIIHLQLDGKWNSNSNLKCDRCLKKKKVMYRLLSEAEGCLLISFYSVNALLALSQQKIYTVLLILWHYFCSIGHSNNIKNKETLYTYCTHILTYRPELLNYEWTFTVHKEIYMYSKNN